MAEDARHYERDPAGIAAAGIRGRCPRCGKGALFHTGLVPKPSCDNCGLDYSFADSGDGPAIFAIFILGFGVLGGALIGPTFLLNPGFNGPFLHREWPLLLGLLAWLALGALLLGRGGRAADRPTPAVA